MKRIFGAAMAAVLLFAAPALAQKSAPVRGQQTGSGGAAGAIYASASVSAPYVPGGKIVSSSISGRVKSDLDLPLGASYGAAIGMAVTKNIRAELEWGYAKGNVESNDVATPATGVVRATTFMANGYYDIPIMSKATLFLGAGVGVANMQYENISFGAAPNGTVDASGREFAWQVALGSAYEISSSIVLQVDYRYLDVSDTDVTGGGPYLQFGYRQSTVRVGARYRF